MEASLEALVGRELRARGWTLALGESCTGGLVGHRITQVTGSSDYFAGGVIAYTNEAKGALLGVAADTLHTHGAVSAETAVEMASGAREAFAADVGLSVTGIAGPGGGTANKPVGLTFIGVVTPAAERVERYQWSGDRQSNKEDSAEAALQLVLLALGGEAMQEPVTVETHLESDGTLRPLAFIWRDQRHAIESYGRRWEQGGQMHFLVQDGSLRTFELAYSTDQASWTLLRTPEDFGPRRRSKA